MNPGLRPRVTPGQVVPGPCARVAAARNRNRKQEGLSTSYTTMIQRDITQSLDSLLRAWEELAPDAVFSEMTLEQFRTATAAAYETRQQIAWLDQQRLSLMATRAIADEAATEQYLLVVHSIKGSPKHGENSPLYRALGYVTKAERRSGLTRRNLRVLPELKKAA